MAITQAQTQEICRMLGYPNLSPASSLELGYPYYASPFAQWQPYAMLLDRLARTAPGEEVAILGAESTSFAAMFVPALVQFTFSTPTSVVVGANVELDLAGTLISYQTVAGDTPSSVSTQMASLVRQNTTALAQFMPNSSGANLTLYVRARGTEGNGVSIVATSSDPSLFIAISPASASQYSYGVTGGGSNPQGPFYIPEGATDPIYGYLPIIRTLEGDLINSRENLDLAKVESYVPRADEMGARAALWRFYRRQLADRLSVPLDPDIAGNAQRLSQRVV